MFITGGPVDTCPCISVRGETLTIKVVNHEIHYNSVSFCLSYLPYLQEKFKTDKMCRQSSIEASSYKRRKSLDIVEIREDVNEENTMSRYSNSLVSLDLGLKPVSPIIVSLVTNSINSES